MLSVRIFAIIIALILSNSTLLCSQIFPGPEGRTVLRGELGGLGEIAPQSLTVELYEAGGHTPGDRTFVNPSGGFEFHAAPLGVVELRVVTPMGDILKREWVDTIQGGGPISIRLNRKEPERPVSGTVSARRLAHKMPGKARKEFVQSAKAFEEGDAAASLAHLRKAVAADPEYFEALNNLGVRLLQAKEYPEAAGYLERALRLDPYASATLINYGVAMIYLRRPDRAERAAREALRVEIDSAPAQYVLGVSLLSQGKPIGPRLAEAVRSFTQKP